MSQRKSLQVKVRPHKLVAIVMGACIVILLIHRIWQEGMDSLVTALEQSFK